MSKHQAWSSDLSFALACIASAIGLANLLRFPAMVADHGGTAFILIYLFCLLGLGLPVFLAEISIGRATGQHPAAAFKHLGGPRWQGAGVFTIITGLLVSAFYSVIAGWILGYTHMAITGQLSDISSVDQASTLFNNLIQHPTWAVYCHSLFITAATLILALKIQQGLERSNQWLMLVLLALLSYLWLVTFSQSPTGTWQILLTFNWQQLTPQAGLAALGHAFFTLSIGQGTMVTYGSYAQKKTHLLKVALPVMMVDTWVSLIMAMIVLTLLLTTAHTPHMGLALLFETMPSLFYQYSNGQWLLMGFFLLVLLAALTSHISAMEPAIAWLRDKYGLKRCHAACLVGLTAWAIGVPCALSYNLLLDYQIFGLSWLSLMEFACTNLLIPLGGLFAVLLIGYRWPVKIFWQSVCPNKPTPSIKLLVAITFYYRYILPSLIILLILSLLWPE